MFSLGPLELYLFLSASALTFQDRVALSHDMVVFKKITHVEEPKINCLGGGAQLVDRDFSKKRKN